MANFTRRRYESVGQFWKDLCGLLKLRKELRGILKGKTISDAFRERLILAVTAVNKCRYCAFVHTRAALASGVPKEEMDGLFSGEFADAPEEERVALLYAQHWAETRGCPDAETVMRLNETYPPEIVSAINSTLLFINLNNLFGNTVDWLLHTITFGALGGEK